jgi:protease secretion system membrane fusion protein
MNPNTQGPVVLRAGAPRGDAAADAMPPEADTRQTVRLGLWVLVVGFALFVLWAALAPLDEGVVAPATVSTETRRQAIQHQQGGVIRRVAVLEGQPVKAGDLLVELEEAASRAGFESVRQNYLAQRASESRLLAELAGDARIRFHEDLVREADAVSMQLMAAQERLFQARRSALTAEIAAAEESVAGLRSQIVGLQEVIASRRAQRELLMRQLEGVRAMAAEGYAPRNQVLQLEQQVAELQGSMADAEAQLQRTRNAIAEAQLRITQRREEAVKEVSAQLADVRREVQANQERLVATGAELARTQIVAPIDGQVVGLAVSGVGGVVSAGQRIMEIVPQRATLLLDARVPTHVIDRVRAGDATEVRFSGFVDAPTLVVHGRVLSLSGDAISEQVGGMVNSYYLARVELTPEGQQALGGRAMHPGMPAEVLVKTGERSLLTYLLHPLTKRIAAAMKEE